MNLDFIYVFIPFIFFLTSQKIFIKFIVSFLILSSRNFSIFLCLFFVCLLYFLFKSSSKPSVSFLVFLWLFYILEEFFEFSLSFFIYNLMDSYRFFIGFFWIRCFEYLLYFLRSIYVSRGFWKRESRRAHDVIYLD